MDRARTNQADSGSSRTVQGNRAIPDGRFHVAPETCDIALQEAATCSTLPASASPNADWRAKRGLFQAAKPAIDPPRYASSPNVKIHGAAPIIAAPRVSFRPASESYP